MVNIFDAVMLKSVGDAVPKAIFDKDPGKNKVYEKPKRREGMLKTNPKSKFDLKLYYYQYSTEKRTKNRPEGIKLRF